MKLSIRSEDKNKDVVDEIKSSNNKVENTFEEKVNNNSNKVIGGISSKGKVDMAEMVEYMDILEFLKENKGKLEELLDASNDNGKLPNYAVPGINTTKTFSISAMLSNLIEEYSIGKGVSQKEMLQIAMVEFLMNHGYKEEMQILLNRK